MDLQDLFARLQTPAERPAATAAAPKQNEQTRTWSFGALNDGAAGSSQNQNRATISSPFFDPGVGGTQPRHSSAVMSPNLTSPNGSTISGPKQSSDFTNPLLSLLKFNSGAQMGNAQTSLQQKTEASAAGEQQRLAQPSEQSGGGGGGTRPPQGRAVSASDTPASFTRKPTSSSAYHHTINSPPPIAVSNSKAEIPSTGQPTATSENNPQEALLKLLNRPKPAASSDNATGTRPQNLAPSVDQAPEVKSEDTADILKDTPIRNTSAGRSGDEALGAARSQGTPVAAFKGDQPGQSSSLDSARPMDKGRFTYSNPFEALAKVSPKPRTPKPETKRARTPEVSKPKPEPGAETATLPKPLAGKKTPPPAPVVLSPVPQRNRESVSQALNEVGKEVDKEVEAAIAQTGGADRRAAKENGAVAETLQEGVADSWESADADDVAEKPKGAVVVYNFPSKPFTSIEIKNLPGEPPKIREDIVMEIARLKQTFDQIDRIRATASINYVVYALAKGGGFRVLAQDSGHSKLLFRSSEDRIFHLAVCVPGPKSDSGVETVLATGVSGSVYWTSLNKPSALDDYEDDNPEERGMIFPPIPSQDENTSGGQLKTRAKKSSRHPGIFAIGRGKSIHIIWPFIAASQEYRDQKTKVVDAQRYLQERRLMIATGKAGKDFAFSEDDTVICSLDKAGKLRFWDISQLIAESQGVKGKLTPIEVKEPIQTLDTVSPSDKSWPTSVMFIDRERPHTKGIALRFVLVGMKQNHTLQLWDLALGKAVQEIRFPHENESDGICSISYHPKTGIIAVGHPTRNSIYFIHLSAPKYNLNSNLTQAQYIEKLARNDPMLPKPETTAIMSGIREYSFRSREKGELLSLDMLVTPNTLTTADEDDEPALFELYAAHTKGITCLSVRARDLGWNKDNKVLNGMDAQKTGLIEVRDLRAMTEGPAQEVPSQPAAEPTKAKFSPVSRPKSPVAQTHEKELPPPAEQTVTSNGTDKTGKKKAKKTPGLETPTRQSTTREPKKPDITTPASYALTASKARSPSPSAERPTTAEEVVPEASMPVPQETAPSSTMDFSQLSQTLASEFSRELTKFSRRIDEDKRVADAAAASRQDAMLRLVSSTLTDNVEKSLTRIITATVTNEVVPRISDVTAAAIDKRLAQSVKDQLQTSVPRELRETLPKAVSRAMQEPETLRTISDLVSAKVAAHVESEIASVLNSKITPAFTNLALAAASKVTKEVEDRVGAQLRTLEAGNKREDKRIEELTQLVRVMSDAVLEMTGTQKGLQEQIVDLKRDIAQQQSATTMTTASLEASKPKDLIDVEIEEISRRMQEGDVEGATVQWIKSPNQPLLFDRLFVHYSPSYLSSVTPVVALSAVATVSASLLPPTEAHPHDGHDSPRNIPERLSWLEHGMARIDPRDPESAQYVPGLMKRLDDNLLKCLHWLVETNDQDPSLGRISRLRRAAIEIGNMAEQGVGWM